jgi:hypothetical protein
MQAPTGTGILCRLSRTLHARRDVSLAKSAALSAEYFPSPSFSSFAANRLKRQLILL